MIKKTMTRCAIHYICWLYSSFNCTNDIKCMSKGFLDSLQRKGFTDKRAQNSLVFARTRLLLLCHDDCCVFEISVTSHTLPLTWMYM